MSPDLTLRLAPEPSAPRLAREAVVRGLALDGGLAHDAALLVSEAVTNSVLHAGLADDRKIHVDAWWAGERLHVEVCDEGGGLSRASVAADDREGGFGLRIVAKLAARWGVHTDGHTRIWFELAA